MKEQCFVCKGRGFRQSPSLKPEVAVYEKCEHCNGVGSLELRAINFQQSQTYEQMEARLKDAEHENSMLSAGVKLLSQKPKQLIERKIAECEKSLELYDECTTGHIAITEAINALREVLGEI